MKRRSLLRLALALYKKTLSPLLAFLIGGGCRFTPTCSEFAVEAMEIHGALRGSWLAICRLCRCQPWGGSGYDPVPQAKTPTKITPTRMAVRIVNQLKSLSSNGS